MHPSGVQFGLSRGLRQLRGEEILLSDQLVETISLQAQMYLARQTCDSGQFPGGYHRPRGAGRVRKSISRPPRRDCSLLREWTCNRYPVIMTELPAVRDAALPGVETGMGRVLGPTGSIS